MDRMAKGKLELAVVAIVLVLFFLLMPVVYFILDAPVPLMVVVAVIYAVLAIAMVYYVRQRYEEIEGGLEDAVDDY